MQNKSQRTWLKQIAHRIMLEKGLSPDFSQAVIVETNAIKGPAKPAGDPILRDMRNLLWASIDNDDSRDLDQLTVSESLPDGNVKIFVSIADVDSLIKQESAIDGHAKQNTTSVYTPAIIFTMLPEKFSTDFTSLNEGEDRLSIVIEMEIKPDGTIAHSDIYPAFVCNKAKLTYNAVGAWLEGNGPVPDVVAKISGLEQQLKVQDRIAQILKRGRHSQGSLSLETIETHTIFEDDSITGLEAPAKNRAHQLIEDFMIAANGVSARFLAAKKFPCIRRVVRVPARWDRIVSLANENGQQLPAVPDSKALDGFLTHMREKDPVRFPDLSLAVIKLLGSGEYVAEFPGEKVPGHFGLAVRSYSHTTAPNRRFPDLITQRLLKAALLGKEAPYTNSQIESLAALCTEKEDAAAKVERLVKKSAAAMLLSSQVGNHFEGIVTGASAKGTWIRVFQPPVEGKVMLGAENVDVGDKIKVQLVSVDIEKGFIDFARVK